MVDDIENLAEGHTKYHLDHDLYLIAFPQQGYYKGLKTAKIPYVYKEQSICDRVVFDIDNEDDLEQSWTEAKALYQYAVNEYGGDPLIIFTGKKGFQCYIYFEPLLINWSAVKMYQDKIADALVPSADRNVHGDASRLLRMPYSQHQSTGRWSIPVTIDMTLDEIIDESLGNRPHYPYIKSPQNRRGITPPLTYDYHLHKIQQKIEREKRRAMKPNYDGPSDIQNWNVMDKVFPMFFESGQLSGDRYIVKCPFHNDNHPSAYYSERTFYCSSCEINVGTYDFLMKYVGKSKEETLQIIRSVQ